MFFELFCEADEDNITRSRLVCDVYKKGNEVVVEFTQFERSDLNKWGKPKVLTDVYVTLFYMPEVFNQTCSLLKLGNYIKDNYDGTYNIVDEISKFAKVKNNIIISMPTSTYLNERGLPVSPRAIKDTYLPLIVNVNGKDVSEAFMDFGDYQDEAASKAYSALVQGVMPKNKNHIFYIDGVKALYDDLQNLEQ